MSFLGTTTFTLPTLPSTLCIQYEEAEKFLPWPPPRPCRVRAILRSGSKVETGDDRSECESEIVWPPCPIRYRGHISPSSYLGLPPICHLLSNLILRRSILSFPAVPAEILGCLLVAAFWPLVDSRRVDNSVARYPVIQLPGISASILMVEMKMSNDLDKAWPSKDRRRKQIV